MKKLYYYIFFLFTTLLSQTGLTQCNGNLTAQSWSGNNYYQFNFWHTQTASFTYQWNYGDGTIGPGGHSTSHTYANAGTYSVSVIYTDITNGCVDYDTIIINGPCDASFTMKDTNANIVCTPNIISPTIEYAWGFSDGQNPTTPIASWNYSNGGSGNLSVILTVSDSINSCISSVQDTISYVDPDYMTKISGTGEIGTTLVDTGMAYLIEYDAGLGTLTAIDSMGFDTSTSYYYTFSNLVTGSYLIKLAVQPSSAQYATTLPTYYNNPVNNVSSGSLYWSNADFITIPDSTGKFVHHVGMVTGNNPGGPGFVGGLISQGANKVGDPISNVNVIVLDLNGDPVSHGTSNAKGEFLIDNLPLGTYSIYPEVEGKTTIPINVTLSSTNLGSNLLRVEVNSSTIEVSIATGIKNMDNTTAISVYPNPVNQYVVVDLGEVVLGTISVRILDASGKEIYDKEVNNAEKVQLDTSKLKTGIYILKIKTDLGEKSFKITK